MKSSVWDGGTQVRTVDTREYVSMLRELVREGKEVSVTISGSSMAPFLIHARDSICLRRPGGSRSGGIWCFMNGLAGSL